MKKFLLLPCIGLVAFSSQCFGMFFEEEKQSPQKKNHPSGKENLKIKRQANFFSLKKEETHLSEEKKYYNTKKSIVFLDLTNEEKKPKPILKNQSFKENSSEKSSDKVKKMVHFQIPLKRTKNIYVRSTSDCFQKNVTPELLVQEGRGNGPSPQTLQVKFEYERKEQSPSLENELQEVFLPLTRGTTFYIPNPNEAVETFFNALEPKKLQSKKRIRNKVKESSSFSKKKIKENPNEALETFFNAVEPDKPRSKSKKKKEK